MVSYIPPHVLFLQIQTMFQFSYEMLFYLAANGCDCVMFFMSGGGGVSREEGAHGFNPN